MSLSSRWMQFGRDGLQVAKVLWTNTRATSMEQSNRRPMSVLLMEQVKTKDGPLQRNSVAHSLLNLHKQWGLVRYYGVWQYVQQQQPFRRLSTDAAGGSGPPTAGGGPPMASSPSTAKVAFMVTASMKKELEERLHYSPEQIKTLTPLQASLILHHSLIASKDEVNEGNDNQLSSSNSAWSMELKQLEQDHALKQKEQQKKQQELLKREEEKAATSNRSAPSPEEAPLQLAAGQTTPSPPPPRPTSPSSSATSFPFSSPNLLIDPEDPLTSMSSAPSPAWGDEWYELIETIRGEGDDDDTILSQTRIGLYQDHDEAQIGLETRQEMMQNQSKVQYERQEKRQRLAAPTKDNDGHDDDEDRPENASITTTTSFEVRPIHRAQL